MKSVDDMVLKDEKKSSVMSPDLTTVSHLLEQGKFCKELYLSLGVHPSDLGENDEDVESILEQMSRLQNSTESSDGGLERNIDDILKEAESLLDGQRNETQSLSLASNVIRENVPCPDCDFSEVCSLANIDVESGSSSLKEPCPSFCESPKKLDRALNCTYTKSTEDYHSKSDVTESQNSDKQIVSKKDFSITESLNRIGSSHIIGTPLEVTYQRIHEQIRKEMDGSLKSNLCGDFPDLRLSMPVPGVETPCIDVPSCFSLEQEFLDERKRCLKLRADLDWLKKQHEREVAELCRHHEGQLLLVRQECRTHDEKDAHMHHLQQKVENQERIISGYQMENENLCAELKDIKRALLKLMALLKSDSSGACVD